MGRQMRPNTSRVLITILSLIALTGCAPAGVKNVERVEVERTKTFDASFDQVWAVTVEWFASLGIPIEKVEKSSGLISSEWGGVGSDQTYISCGEPTGNIGLYGAEFERINIDINIIVRPVDSGVRSTINIFGTAVVDVSNALGSVSKNTAQCASRGTLEKNYFSFLRSSL
jgi:hypothetical protein